MERQRQRQRVSERDRLSDLPDCVLLHILKFMPTKDAVQTCVLSKRWKDLWKRLTCLTLRSYNFRRIDHFDKFVTQLMSHRDGFTSLHTLDFYLDFYGCSRTVTGPEILKRVIGYVMSHNVRELTIHANLNVIHDFEWPPCFFSCRSLTFLKLCTYDDGRMSKLPKSLEMPALKSLYLEHVTFTASDSDFAEPFSTCNVLNTLAITCCSLERGAKVLCISNDKLSSFTVDNFLLRRAYKIRLSTPNLSYLNFMADPIQLPSVRSLAFLQEVSIDVRCYPDVPETALVLIRWLQVLANVKIMTVSSRTLKIIRNVFSTPSSMKTQPPSFVRLKSLKLKMNPYSVISDEEASRTVEYLLQNSPLAKVDTIHC